MITKRTTVALIQCYALVFVVSMLTGCAGTVSRVPLADEPITDVEASDVDIRAMSVQMASELLGSHIIVEAKNPLTIAFLNIENRTLTTDFDSYNLLSTIRGHLLENCKGKIVFLDREKTDAILAERDAKRAGQLTTKGHKDLYGADYFLTGYAYSMRKPGGSGQILAYHRYEFRLTDTETSAVVWQWSYEFKKHGQRGTAYR